MTENKRGGTTTLYHALVRHPQVAPLVPRIQRTTSPQYFALQHHRGNAWYRSHFPVPRPGRISGEADPYLLYHPLAPERVAQEAPGRAWWRCSATRSSGRSPTTGTG